ncbi:serine hydrolase domain-containing protein, partial [Streptomyces sp. NPDC005349]|uniref:serine hydrolase domain-containing protein n=1 Tax=Streptomyces sp. NPDC005349 TaxID=3157037 RepID=UPI0033AC6A84
MEQRHGWADERFGAVADVFARNFTEFPELGAAVTVFAEGRKVVDLWGGVADERTGRAWEQDTTVPVFSVAKGLVSVGAHLLAQEGRLDLDAPVSRYWPEFAQHGKESTPRERLPAMWQPPTCTYTGSRPPRPVSMS